MFAPSWRYSMSSAAVAAPTVTSVTNVIDAGSVGDIAGGYQVNIVGTGFVVGATTLQVVGGSALTAVTVSSSTAAVGTLPAHASGVNAISATTAGGTSTVNASYEFYSPAQESLTQWNRAPFASAPLAGNASAGSSAGKTAVTGGSDPTVGANLNGYATVANAASQFLSTTPQDNALYSSTAFTFTFVFKATSFDAFDATNYNNGIFSSDGTNAECAIGCTSSGLYFCFYNGSYITPSSTAIPVSTGTWHVAQFKFDGANIKMRLDGGAWTSVAATSISFPNPSICNIGRSYAGSHFFKGLWAEAFWSAVAVTDANLDKHRGYLRTRYQLSTL